MPRPTDEDDDRPRKPRRRREEDDDEDYERPTAKKNRRRDRDDDTKSGSKSKLILFIAIGAVVLLAAVGGGLFFLLMKPTGNTAGGAKNYDIYNSFVANKPQQPMSNKLVQFALRDGYTVDFYRQTNSDVIKMQSKGGQEVLKKGFVHFKLDPQNIKLYAVLSSERESHNFIFNKPGSIQSPSGDVFELFAFEFEQPVILQPDTLKADYTISTVNSTNFYLPKLKSTDPGYYLEHCFTVHNGLLIYMIRDRSANGGRKKYHEVIESTDGTTDILEKKYNRFMTEYSGFDHLRYFKQYKDLDTMCFVTVYANDSRFHNITVGFPLSPSFDKVLLNHIQAESKADSKIVYEVRGDRIYGAVLK
jgi:hypothetical protein